MFRFLVKLPNVLLISLTIIAGSITLALALARPNEVPIRRSLDFSTRIFLLRTLAFPCTGSFSKLDPRIRLFQHDFVKRDLGTTILPLKLWHRAHHDQLHKRMGEDSTG